MVPLLTILCYLFLVLETLVGMVANGSIVLLNFIDWFRRRKLSPTDLILTCLGLSRLLLQTIVILDVTLSILLCIILSYIVFTLVAVWTFTSTMNIWFAACLSVFYLAKIAIFSHPVFLQVMRRISGFMPWLLLGSVAFSVFVTIIVTSRWSYGLSTCNPYKSLSSNRSNAEMNVPIFCMHILAVLSAFHFIPFVAFLSSSVFLISSLWKHMRRVQHNGKGSKDLSTQAQWSAIKALASFAVLHVVNIAATTLQSLLLWNSRHPWITVLYNVSALYLSGHAIILILINPKLKQAWARMLHHLKCRSS